MKGLFVLLLTLLEVCSLSSFRFGQTAPVTSGSTEASARVEEGSFVLSMSVGPLLSPPPPGKLADTKPSVLVSTKGGDYQLITSKKTVFKGCERCPAPDASQEGFCQRIETGFIDSLNKYTVRGTLTSAPKGWKGDAKAKFVDVKMVERSTATLDESRKVQSKVNNKVKLVIENP
jgi:hypothetical protein